MSKCLCPALFKLNCSVFLLLSFYCSFHCLFSSLCQIRDLQIIFSPDYIPFYLLTGFFAKQKFKSFYSFYTFYDPFSIKHVKVSKLCPTLCDPMDCSPPGSSVHGILRVRIPEWVAISYSRGSSRPRDWTWISCIAGRFFTVLAHNFAGQRAILCSGSHLGKLGCWLGFLPFQRLREDYDSKLCRLLVEFVSLRL